MSSMVIKFNPEGRVELLLGRKSESEQVPARPLDAPPGRAGRGPAGAGQQSDVFQRPTDVAWDAAGNIYVADGLGYSRIAKFDKNGKFVKSWGSRGSAQSQFNKISGIAIDAQGNVYAADAGNKRIQIFDGEGNFKTQIENVRSPQPPSASRPDRARFSTARTQIPRKISTPAVRSSSSRSMERSLGNSGKPGNCLKNSAP